MQVTRMCNVTDRQLLRAYNNRVCSCKFVRDQWDCRSVESTIFWKKGRSPYYFTKSSCSCSSTVMYTLAWHKLAIFLREETKHRERNIETVDTSRA